MVFKPDHIRVLVVDDDVALLDALSQTLRLHFDRIEVVTVESALDALVRVSAEDYDAIISDIKMPGTDGLDLLAKLRNLAPEIPVLLITGHGETDMAIQALRLQAYDLIPKPFDREYLLAALARAVEARRLRAEVRQKQEALERHAQHLEHRVQERTEELRRANRYKDEFLGLVAHGINSPLSVILGNAELLNDRFELLEEEDRRQVVDDIRQESRRLKRIFENLLVLGRAELNARLETEPVNLRRVIEEQVQAHRLSFPKRQIEVCCPDHAVVLGDATYTELILGNLLSNAEKYSDETQPIQIVLEADGGDFLLSVLDRGPGISREEAPRLFEPFYRSEASARRASGVGIGLAVCKRLVEVQGGSISASPREDGGSRFTVRLVAASRAGEA